MEWAIVWLISRSGVGNLHSAYIAVVFDPEIEFACLVFVENCRNGGYTFFEFGRRLLVLDGFALHSDIHRIIFLVGHLILFEKHTMT